MCDLFFSDCSIALVNIGVNTYDTANRLRSRFGEKAAVIQLIIAEDLDTKDVTSGDI